MDTKPIITYIKNGEEKIKIINLFNKYKTITTIFENPFRFILRENIYIYGEDDYYQINEGIEYLHLKNITFYQNVRFICPKDTILILENCTFKGNMLNFYGENGGSVQVINPNLPKDYYCNRIYASGLDDFSIQVENQNQYLNLSLNAKKSYIHINEGISKLYLTGKEITLQNISNLKQMIIQAEHIKIIDSNIQIPKVENMDFDPERTMKTTNIETNIIEFQNSNIYSYAPLTIKCNQIKLENSTTLTSYDDITIGSNIYKNPAPFEFNQSITKQTLLTNSKEDITNRALISTLKTIKQKAEEEITRETDYFIDKKNPKLKSKTKRKVQGMYENRKIGTYKDFSN